jgi:4a-hydroxytetrahydrobiopterin dehydratase
MHSNALVDRHCRPLSGPNSRLAPDAVATALTQLPGWELAEEGKALIRTYHFDDYYRTLAFVNGLAHIAHREDHHPDLGVHFNRCVVRYSTHDAGGLTDNDLICAARAEQLFAG